METHSSMMGKGADLLNGVRAVIMKHEAGHLLIQKVQSEFPKFCISDISTGNAAAADLGTDCLLRTIRIEDSLYNILPSALEVLLPMIGTVAETSIALEQVKYRF